MPKQEPHARVPLEKGFFCLHPAELAGVIVTTHKIYVSCKNMLLASEATNLEKIRCWDGLSSHYNTALIMSCMQVCLDITTSTTERHETLTTAPST